LETQNYYSEDSGKIGTELSSSTRPEENKWFRQGMSSFNIREYSRSIDLLAESVKELKIKYPDGKNLELADSLDVMARCYQEKREYQNATQYYNEAIEIYNFIPEHDISRLANTLYNNGYCHNELRNYEKSKDFAIGAITLLESIGQGQTSIAANAHHNAGLAYFNLGLNERDVNKRINYYEKSIEHSNIAILTRNNSGIDNKNSKDLVEYYGVIGMAQKHLADTHADSESKHKLYEDSLNNFCTALKSLKSLDQGKSSMKSMDYYDSIYRNYYELNDLEQSMKYCQKYLDTALANNYTINQNYKVKENCDMIKNSINSNINALPISKVICEYDEDYILIEQNLVGEIYQFPN